MKGYPQNELEMLLLTTTLYCVWYQPAQRCTEQFSKGLLRIGITRSYQTPGNLYGI